MRSTRGLACHHGVMSTQEWLVEIRVVSLVLPDSLGVEEGVIALADTLGLPAITYDAVTLTAVAPVVVDADSSSIAASQAERVVAEGLARLGWTAGVSVERVSLMSEELAEAFPAGVPPEFVTS